MPLNPIAFTDRVVSSFLRYQLTTYPFADARLRKQMRDLLSLENPGDATAQGALSDAQSSV